MNRLLLGLAALVLLASEAKLPDSIHGQQMLDDVKMLSSERYQGRFTGTSELDQVSQWIAKNFQKSGLKAPFSEKNSHPSYRQKFVVNTDSKLGRKNSLSVGGRSYSAAVDFLPRVFSSSGQVEAPLVFAGYGISSSEHNYDDYKELDVKGKVVVVLRYEPQDQDEKSVFDGRNRTRHSSIETKAINAKMHGAAALILINNAVIYPEDADKLESFGNQSGAMDCGIPVVQIKANLADKWFNDSGHELKGIVKSIDRSMQPQSFRFPLTTAVKMRIEIERIMRPTFNVAAFLPGETDDYIVIGAHYDHLGYGRQFSMAPSEVPKIHPGADDNASGTAAVLELARYLARQPKMKRGILFATFSGEEIGLLGSSYLASNMPLPVEKCMAMINIDMVGRMKDGKFFVAGTGTGSNFKNIVEGITRSEASLKPDFSESLNIGGSDHTSFISKKIPALFFFTGLHADYHKPSDTWDKIEPGSYGKLIGVVAAAAHKLATASERTEFRRVEAPAVASGGGGGGGYGPYFGSVPDFAEIPDGVKLADVRAGSPAEKGGVRGGDILVEFDGKKVSNLQDYTFLLRSKSVGNTVEVKVKRLGETLTFRVVLEARK